MPMETAFAHALLQRRHMLGLTQAQAAERCDLSERGYQKIEQGEVVPRLDTVGRIARELGVDLNAVLAEAYAGELQPLV